MAGREWYYITCFITEDFFRVPTTRRCRRRPKPRLFADQSILNKRVVQPSKYYTIVLSG